MTQRPPTNRPFRKRWLLLWAALGAVIGAGVHYLVPKVYEARASIVVVPPRVPADFLKPTVTAGLDKRLRGMSARVLSRSRLERLILEFDLYERERPTMIMEDVVEGMRHDITVRSNGRQSEDATTFSISFAYTDADTTRRVVARLAQLFIDESLQERGVLTAGFHQFLEAQAEELRSRLANSDSQLRDWAVKHPQHRPPQELVIENDVLQESYKAILRNTQASEMAISLETRQIGEQFRLLDPARLPEKPIRPSLYAYLIVGALGGVAFLLLLLLASSLWRRRRVRGAPVPA
jgi:uncharacterized protein involved in exopolysaccharide biosynthesis